MSLDRQIQKIHLTATGPEGEQLAVVTYTNGKCGITRDGKPSVDLEWPLDQIARCVSVLLRLAGLAE